MSGATAAGSRVRWLAEPIAPVVGLFAPPAVRLFLTSAVILFVELILIRWIPANVTFIGFFRNFLLMASFLGIGAGILFGRDERRLPISPFALVLLAVSRSSARRRSSVQIATEGEIFFGLSEAKGGRPEFPRPCPDRHAHVDRHGGAGDAARARS